MLGNTGAQGYVFPPTVDMKKKKTSEVVKMTNGSTSSIYQMDSCTIKDEDGNKIKLQGRRIVGDIAHPILSKNFLPTQAIPVEKV